MVRPTTSERLAHILEAIHQIESNTADLTAEQLRADRFRQLGIERCLEIISEASRHIPTDLKAKYPNIPWRRVADIGNRIRHAYHAVDTDIIWEIIAVELTELKAAIAAMMSADDRGP
jgi:uncharacterized protein with HEPN domain